MPSVALTDRLPLLVLVILMPAPAFKLGLAALSCPMVTASLSLLPAVRLVILVFLAS